MCPEDMVSKLLDENTANIEKAKSLTAGLSAARMTWQPQPRKWSIAQNLAHLAAGDPQDLDPSPVPSQPRVPKGSSAMALSATAG
jgi:hypothetical protein